MFLIVLKISIAAVDDDVNVDETVSLFFVNPKQLLEYSQGVLGRIYTDKNMCSEERWR